MGRDQEPFIDRKAGLAHIDTGDGYSRIVPAEVLGQYTPEKLLEKAETLKSRIHPRQYWKVEFPVEPSSTPPSKGLKISPTRISRASRLLRVAAAALIHL